MGDFPEGRHYLSAAGQNWHIGPLRRGLIYIATVLFSLDLQNPGLEAPRFEGSKFRNLFLDGSWTPRTWGVHVFATFQRGPGPVQMDPFKKSRNCWQDLTVISNFVFDLFNRVFFSGTLEGSILDNSSYVIWPFSSIRRTRPLDGSCSTILTS